MADKVVLKVSASNLKDKDNDRPGDLSDPFFLILDIATMNPIYESETVEDNLNPDWNETKEIPVGTYKFRLTDRNLGEANNGLGMVECDISKSGSYEIPSGGTLHIKVVGESDESNSDDPNPPGPSGGFDCPCAIL